MESNENFILALFWPQVLVGLFGSSLRMLDLMPGSHGPAPFQQATVNLLAYCTSAPWAPA